MPKVSIIIPSYNHEKYIYETIQSILDQTFQDFEIIVVDDGSQDNSVNEINKFKDPRIKLHVFEKNQGACEAVHFGLKESKGTFISVLSSDDIFLPDKLEKQVNFLESHNDIGAVFSLAQIIDEDGNNFNDKNHYYYNIFNQANRSRFEWLNYFFNSNNCLCHPSILIRKKCCEELNYSDKRFPQLGDLELWTRLCIKYDIHIIQEALIKFRIRKNQANASGDKIETKIRSYWELSQILKNYLKINSVDEFIKIFPEAEKHSEKLEPDLIPFLLAIYALEKDASNYKLFAANTLFELLKDESSAEKLREKFGFTYSDYYKITGNLDIFNLKLESIFRLLLIKFSQKIPITKKLKKFINLSSNQSFKDMIKCEK